MDWNWRATAIIMLVLLAYQNGKKFTVASLSGKRNEEDEIGMFGANALLCVVIIVLVALIP